MAVYLSTLDNPFNPDTHFDQWYAYDLNMGYDCSGRIARVIRDSEALSPSDRDRVLEEAIDRVLMTDEFGLYIKVRSDSD